VGTFGLAPSTPCETDNAANDTTGLAYDLPVKRGLDLTGPMSARLHVSTTGSDAFVTLHLEDVAPDGTASEITGGWDTLSLRALDMRRSTRVGRDIIPFHPYTQDSVQQIESGRVYEWWVEIRASAARLEPGHRLRLSVQPSDAVRFLPTAPKTAAMAGSALTLHHDRQYPSYVVLPVTR
jgi:predicted acyl esterase